MLLATFDIFDTALVRKCGQPDVVPHLVAHRLWPDDEMARCEFLNARRQAATGKGADCTIADIYAAECLQTLRGHSAERIMREELAVESEMLVVNHNVKQQIARMRSEGWTIKFLSDMYLPSAWLKEVLIREGCAEDDDEVIVSCEWNARKDSGTLYRAVRAKYAPAKWRHFGDNRRSDYRMARRNGVKATLICSSYTAVESRICREGRAMRRGWQMALLAGMSRAARLSQSDIAAQRLAADYVAALYIPFVLWVLRSAETRGIGRLHFLSRDGYIMMKIAEALSPVDIELNYLFVSRRSLMRAYLATDPATRYIEIADRKSLIMRHVDQLLAQLQITTQQLALHGIDFSYKTIRTAAQQDDFLRKLFSHNTFTPELLSQLGEDARLTRDYLKQEGLRDGSAQAMVDIGWLGTSRHMVNRILGADIPTYYIGVRSDVYPRSSGDFDSFFACGQLTTEATGLIENYFSASPWPSTAGYALDENGLIEPRFDKGQKFTETPTTTANIDTCCLIARELKPYLDLLDDDVLFRWAKTSVDSIAEMRDKIDLSPIVANSHFDGAAMARKLGVLELLNFTLLGARYTAFDRASVNLTVGHRCASTIWKLHSITARMRGRLYTAYLNRRK